MNDFPAPPPTRAELVERIDAQRLALESVAEAVSDLQEQLRALTRIVDLIVREQAQP